MCRSSRCRYPAGVAFAVIILFAICHQTSFAQHIDQFLSKIYFGSDVKKKDTSSINYFKASPYLRFIPDTSVMSTPPAGEMPAPKYFDFEFSTHPYFSWPFTTGAFQITSEIEGLDVDITDLSIAFEFATKSDFDSAYRDIKRQLGQFALGNQMKIPEPMEVNNYKYASTNYNIILVKGVKGKLYYFYVVLNERK